MEWIIFYYFKILVSVHSVISYTFLIQFANCYPRTRIPMWLLGRNLHYDSTMGRGWAVCGGRRELGGGGGAPHTSPRVTRGQTRSRQGTLFNQYGLLSSLICVIGTRVRYLVPIVPSGSTVPLVSFQQDSSPKLRRMSFRIYVKKKYIYFVIATTFMRFLLIFLCFFYPLEPIISWIYFMHVFTNIALWYCHLKSMRYVLQTDNTF